MSSSANHFKLGVFVIVGNALLIVGIVALGAAQVFKESIMIETYINETVQGLDIGSPVKQRGKKVGRVSEISYVRLEYDLDPDSQEYTDFGRYVVVRMEIDDPYLLSRSPEELMIALAREIQAGLRAKLASQGLTGMMYIEIDYVDPEYYPALAISWTPDLPYIPSATSTITRFIDSIELAHRTLIDADVKGVSNRVKAFLDAATHSVEDAQVGQLSTELQATLTELRATVAAIREDLVEGEDLAMIMDNARAASLSVRNLTADAEQHVPGILAEAERASTEMADIAMRIDDALVAGDLERALAELYPITQQIQRTLQHLDLALLESEEETRRTIENLRVATQNLRELTNLAKKYPSLVLFGEAPTKSEPGQ